MKRNQGGFTLVEMMVTIVIGSLVTLAATTVLLLGLRINNRSTQTVTRQNTARVVITMLENLAAEGEITSIDLKEDQIEGKRGWEIRSAKNAVLASYSEEKQAIYVGSAEKNLDNTPATPLLEEVTASTVSLDANGVLSVSVTIDGTAYKSSIFCRTMRAPKENELDYKDAADNPTVPEETMSETEKAGRTAFLNVLASQYRLKGGSPNPGLILEDKYSTGMYYSQWYLGGTYKDGWDIETPWCACFVSWGLNHETVKMYVKEESWNIKPDADKGIAGGVAFANVDFFCEYFKNLHQEASGENPEKVHWKDAYKNGAYAIPTPGDIIFIDWDGNRDDPAHVGVVLKVEIDYNEEGSADDELVSVYTIEGNRENRVMVCKYDVDENYNIVMGYGIIDWKE